MLKSVNIVSSLFACRFRRTMIMGKNCCLYIYSGTLWYHHIKPTTIHHWLSACYKIHSVSNMEIHSADAGIDTDSDSNNARGNELYIAPSPYPLPLNREGSSYSFLTASIPRTGSLGNRVRSPADNTSPPHHLFPITHPPKTKSPLAISFRERVYCLSYYQQNSPFGWWKAD